MNEAVRFAVPPDEDKIVSMIALLHDENGLFPLSERRVRQYMRRYFDKEGAIIGVVGDEGNPVGSIYLGMEQPYYSETWCLNEAWNFVHPDYRRSDYAKKLIGWAKRISDEMKLPFQIGIVSNHRTEAKIRLYEKQGLERAGAFFIYNRQFAGPCAWDRTDRH